MAVLAESKAGRTAPGAELRLCKDLFGFSTGFTQTSGQGMCLLKFTENPLGHYP